MLRVLMALLISVWVSAASAAEVSQLLKALGVDKGAVTEKGSTLTTDISDLWWVPAESGWGIQFVQSKNVVFATMFVYDQAGNPTWYVALLTYQGNLRWTGAVLATKGPYFGGPFAAGTSRTVGTMTFVGELVHTGTLTYTIDGVSVTKNIQRQTLVNEDYSGTYAGGINLTASGCTNPLDNGTSQQIFAAVLAQVGTAVSIRAANESGIVCTYTGNLTQQGRIGSIDGSYTCPTGEVGVFSLFETQVNITGLTGRIVARSNTCSSVTADVALLRVE